MATFHYNAFSGESAASQWSRYLQTQSYVSDIGEIVAQNRRDLQATIQVASADQRQAFQQVCGTLEDGFREVSQHLQEVNCNISELRGEISAMASMLDWKLSLMIEEQRLTNQLLGQVVQLLRIPDSQKQRAYYIEQGLKYLKNALREGIDSTFFADALEGFRAAEQIERKDYITLNRIGQIHLYSRQHMNIAIAEDYFLKSAREALAEATAAGAPLYVARAKQLLAVGDKIAAIKLVREATSMGLSEAKDFVESGLMHSASPHEAAAAEAYLYAGRACYLQQKLPQATGHAANAYRLAPEFLEAAFEQAKYLAANNQDDEAAAVLQVVIAKDRYFAVKTLTDADLGSKQTVLKLLGKFHAKAISRATQEFGRCRDIITIGSGARAVFDEVERHLSINSFLAAMKALDMLTATRQFPYKEYRRGSDESSQDIFVRQVSPSHTLVDFIRAENQAAKHLEELMQQAKREIIKNSLLGFGFAGAAIGATVGSSSGCTPIQLSTDTATWFGTLIVFLVLGALIGGMVGFIIEPRVRD